MIYIIVCFGLFLGLVYFLLTYKSPSKQEIYFRLALAGVVILVIFVRTYRIDSLQGLDLDEAMGGINSWSIANYGVDFHLVHNPVYLYAWGSGMNILYPLLTVPFVKVLGLSVLSYRLPMVLLSIASSLLLIISFLYAKFSYRKVLIYSIIILLSPGLIIPSRWAVESNIFPILLTFILSFFIFLLYAQSRKVKEIWYWLIIFTLSISAYAYSNNWLFLFAFVLLFFIWSYRKLFHSIKIILLSLITLFFIDWPLIAFIYVNYVSHKQLTICGMTITKLAESRGNSQFIIQSGKPILESIAYNIFETFKVLIQGNDGLLKNGLPGIGLFYPLMVSFAIIGIIYFFEDSKNMLDQFMFIMLVSNIFTVMLISPNFTHLNALILPILYFESKGVMSVFSSPFAIRIFLMFFFALFSVFSYEYVHIYHSQLVNGNHESPLELQKMIRKANSSNRPIYLVTGDETYTGIYTVVLFAKPMSPYEFNSKTVNVSPAAFTPYTTFGKYSFVKDLTQVMKGDSNILIVKRTVNVNKFMKEHKDYHLYRGQYYDYIEK